MHAVGRVLWSRGTCVGLETSESGGEKETSAPSARARKHQRGTRHKRAFGLMNDPLPQPSRRRILELPGLAGWKRRFKGPNSEQLNNATRLET
eukprot:1874536-Prymnesium_polylepis.1